MTKLTNLDKGDKLRKHILFYGVVFIAFIIIGLLVPDDPANFGIISAIPAAFLIIFIFKTKRIIEALTLAVLLTTIMGYKGEFYGVFNEIILENLMDGDMV